MGLFSKKTKEDDKKTDEKSVGAVSPKQSMKDLYSGEKVKEDVGAGEERKAEGKKYGNAYKVLFKPLVTERASILGAEGKYFFAVERGANKIEIAKAIKEVYNVKPVGVNIINMRGKEVKLGRTRGKRKGWKKAIVTLPKGKTIKVYEGV